jgi:hypothetical protein
MLRRKSLHGLEICPPNRNDEAFPNFGQPSEIGWTK